MFKLGGERTDPDLPVCLFELEFEKTDPDLPVRLFELEFEKSSADSNIGFVEEGAKMLSGSVYNVAALGQAGKNLLEPVTVVSSPV